MEDRKALIPMEEYNELLAIKEGVVGKSAVAFQFERYYGTSTAKMVFLDKELAEETFATQAAKTTEALLLSNERLSKQVDDLEKSFKSAERDVENRNEELRWAKLELNTCSYNRKELQEEINRLKKPWWKRW